MLGFQLTLTGTRRWAVPNRGRGVWPYALTQDGVIFNHGFSIRSKEKFADLIVRFLAYPIGHTSTGVVTGVIRFSVSVGYKRSPNFKIIFHPA